jgi:hypothetical protein
LIFLTVTDFGERRLHRFSRGAEVSVSKSELLVAEQVECADFSSADICSAKPPAVPEAVKRHRKPPGGRVLQGFHEPPPKSVTVRIFHQAGITPAGGGSNDPDELRSDYLEIGVDTTPQV